MRKFKEHFGEICKAVETVNKEDPKHLYEIIPLIKTAKAEFEKESAFLSRFDCLRNCEKYFDNKLADLKRTIRQGLTKLFVEWDESTFQAYMKCYYMLQFHYPAEPSLVDNIQKIVKASIKLTRKQAIEVFTQQTAQGVCQESFSLSNFKIDPGS